VHGAILIAQEAALLELSGAERHQPEQNVVGVAPEPNALRQGWAEPAATGAAVALVASR